MEINYPKRLTLYNAEKPSKKIKDHSHNFIMLVDEESYLTSIVKGIIHFDSKEVPDNNGQNIVSSLQSEERYYRVKPLYAFESVSRPVISGEVSHMMDIWQYCKKVAKKSDDLKLEMEHGEGLKNKNCRAGIALLFNKLGIKYEALNNTQIGLAGTEANLAELPELKEIPDYSAHYGVG